MVSLDDLRDLTLYKKPFYLPINSKNKKKGSSIMLLTPNYKSSMLTMTAPYAVNKNYFQAYYVEKSIARFIYKESVYNLKDPGEYIFEQTLTSKQRKELSDSDYGIPSQRKYPMPDPAHVLAAIRFFNHVDQSHEKELAHNIIKKIKEFNMADQVHVGDGNRFKPYWEKSGLAKKEAVHEAVGRKEVIDKVCKALENEGLKAHISKNSSWGSENFIQKKEDTICLGSFNKDTYNQAYEIVSAALPEGYKANKDNYFTIFVDAIQEASDVREAVLDRLLKALQQEANIIPTIPEIGELSKAHFFLKTDNTIALIFKDEEETARAYEICTSDHLADGYCASRSMDDTNTILITSTDPLDEAGNVILLRRFAHKFQLNYQGYESAVKEAAPFFDKNKKVFNEAFNKFGLSLPKEVTVLVAHAPNADCVNDENSLTVLSPSALNAAGINLPYEMYARYCIWLFAIYNLKVFNGERVLQTLAEPAALLLSGVSPMSDKDEHFDEFETEKVFDYIINTKGFPEFKRILQYNDAKAVIKYSREFHKVIRAASESMNLLEEEANLLEQAPIHEEGIPEPDNVPESIKQLQNMGQKLKRRIRQHSVYKLNKIMRDLQRGNIGAETRGQDSTVTQLQTGDITGDSVTKEWFDIYTKGDYILEGNIAYLFEDSYNYDNALKKTLYKERFRTDKQVLEVYKKVKADLPFIKFAYVNPDRYQGKNVFIDLSRYNETFFRNMALLNDEDRANTVRLFKTYVELMGRLLNDNNFDSIHGYVKQTIFIPILDWQHNNSTKMWIYRNDVNPISVIYYLLKNEPMLLKKIFGNRDIVFLGAKNYFKLNFSTFENKPANITKFLNLVKRIIAIGVNGVADPDPEGEFEDSPKGIAMEIIDKVEKSQNVEINNVSAIDKLTKDPDISHINRMGLNYDSEKIAVRKNIVNAPSTASSAPISIIAGKTLQEVPSKVDGRKKNAYPVMQKEEIDFEVKEKIVSKAQVKADTGVASDTKSVNTTSEEDKKDAIVEDIVRAAKNAASEDDALNTLDSNDFKSKVVALQQDSEDNVRVDKTRASAVVERESEFHHKDVAGKSVKDLLTVNNTKKELPKSSLKVSSINEDWQEMSFINFDKDYDPDSDIVKMLDSMQHWTFPIAVTNIDIKDNSTSEDILDLWTIECVDYKNTKFTLRVDIPRFINGSNFLKLRGNEKTLMIQSALLPIIKTGLDECQIIGSGGYKKVFVRRFGSRKGQSTASASKLLRALSKYSKSHKDFKITYGDSTKICSKYELPIDYIDLAGMIDTIETKNVKIYFNQDKLRSEYEVDDKYGIPIGVMKSTDMETVYQKGQHVDKANERILYYVAGSYPTVSGWIGSKLSDESKAFDEIYRSIEANGGRNTYSKASILNSQIPVVIICAYLEGLIKVMTKAGMTYHFEENIDKKIRSSWDEDYIRFKDGYLLYTMNYSSSLLMNGLKECPTEEWSIKDINNRRMWLDFLDIFSNSTMAYISNGLENFYDCLIDPITKEILEKFKLPTDFVGLMLHANNLLGDNKYVKHIDQAGRRWRRKELIAGYFYNALTTAYQEYANANRNNRKSTKMSMKQSAVIDLIVSKDPAMSDLSVNNALNDVECANTVTNKGLVGMNVARGYTIATRGYDESMLNLLGMDTGFSGNVGINRQATINANIEGGRGFVKTIGGDTDKLSAANTFTMTEAVTPLGSTHDDPPRTLMTYVQTSKHMIRCNNNDPTLITTGADEAMPYITSDIFAFKAKKDGTVVELVQNGPFKENYMVIQYKDNTHELINLSEEVKKNSDGGYYVPMKLDTDLHVGSKVKAGDVVAYDKLSFSKTLGESGNLTANIGTLAKVAIINTDEGYEDSAAITESFAKKIGSDVIMNIETKIEKKSNIVINKEVGDHVTEGDILFSIQEDLGDEASNTLLKNLSMGKEQLSELSSKPIKTKYTGIVEAIEVYRTCEFEEMSDTLKQFVHKHEYQVEKMKKIYKKYGIDSSELPPTDKVPEIGKTKSVNDAVLVVYYIKHNDTVSVGDKIVFYSANKGICKYLIPENEEPYTEFRPNEHIDSFMSLSSVSGRMTCSIPIFSAVSKLMVELDRSIKDLAEIPYDESQL